MKRMITGIALVVIAALGCNTDDDTTWHDGYTPCVHEDGPGPCYWDASETSNGQGRDFIITEGGEVTYP